jgi:hypothetical protein
MAASAAILTSSSRFKFHKFPSNHPLKSDVRLIHCWYDAATKERSDMQLMVLEVLVAFGLSWAALATLMWIDRHKKSDH